MSRRSPAEKSASEGKFAVAERSLGQGVLARSSHPKNRDVLLADLHQRSKACPVPIEGKGVEANRLMREDVILCLRRKAFIPATTDFRLLYDSVGLRGIVGVIDVTRRQPSGAPLFVVLDRAGLGRSRADCRRCARAVLR